MSATIPEPRSPIRAVQWVSCAVAAIAALYLFAAAIYNSANFHSVLVPVWDDWTDAPYMVAYFAGWSDPRFFFSSIYGHPQVVPRSLSVWFYALGASTYGPAAIGAAIMQLVTCAVLVWAVWRETAIPPVLRFCLAAVLVALAFHPVWHRHFALFQVKVWVYAFVFAALCLFCLAKVADQGRRAGQALWLSLSGLWLCISVLSWGGGLALLPAFILVAVRLHLRAAQLSGAVLACALSVALHQVTVTSGGGHLGRIWQHAETIAFYFLQLLGGPLTDPGDRLPGAVFGGVFLICAVLIALPYVRGPKRLSPAGAVGLGLLVYSLAALAVIAAARGPFPEAPWHAPPLRYPAVAIIAWAAAGILFVGRLYWSPSVRFRPAACSALLLVMGLFAVYPYSSGFADLSPSWKPALAAAAGIDRNAAIRNLEPRLDFRDYAARSLPGLAQLALGPYAWEPRRYLGLSLAQLALSGQACPGDVSGIAFHADSDQPAMEIVAQLPGDPDSFETYILVISEKAVVTGLGILLPRRQNFWQALLVPEPAPWRYHAFSAAAGNASGLLLLARRKNASDFCRLAVVQSGG